MSRKAMRSGMRIVRQMRRARVLALAKGFRGMAKTCYRISIRRVHRALRKSYGSRKLKKRDMRQLWITRIGAGSLQHGLPYNFFMSGIYEARIQLDKKIMSQLAMHEPFTFQGIVKIASKQFAYAAKQWRRIY
ncbi:50S ribosomal protein L20, chloroplastic-like [Oopsacas minuta]|uniref:Large ribosomal subunit protein bL20m n=1 Tax=Oopsacas minuta TaxID=111878 RepID=A0AAV7JWU1_9METZ|nr:50S ribosomal protein L20, chloroplastic-like [Oopsacas minuta]